MLYGAIDLFASQYGWTHEYILSKVSLYDFVSLTKQIGSRRKKDALLQLAIVSNPHVKNPRELVDELKEHEETTLDTTYDREGLKNLKNIMSGSKGFIVK